MLKINLKIAVTNAYLTENCLKSKKFFTSLGKRIKKIMVVETKNTYFQR